jgi:DNA-binding response OmpR family regulator
MTMTPSLLVVNETQRSADVIAAGAQLAWPDCRVTVAPGGDEALDRLAQTSPDVVVLDAARAGPTDLEMCRRIRTVSAAPLLVLGAQGALAEKVRALDSGADAYLARPVDQLELLAQLRALVRRADLSARPGPAGRVYAAGDFSLDFATHEVRTGGRAVALTATEYRLLAVLVRHAGTALPHRFLLEQVWGPGYAADRAYLKVYVRRLRRKLDDAAAWPRLLHTVWGVGYRFAAPEAKPA